MRLLKKKFGEDLQLEYKLPKINKVSFTNDSFVVYQTHSFFLTEI